MIVEKKLKLGIYPNTVHLILGKTITEAVEYFESSTKIKVKGDPTSCDGLTIDNGSHNYILIDMSCPDPLSSFTHETVHAAYDVLHRCDIPINYDNAESVCYLTQFIFKSFYKEIMKYGNNGRS